MVTIKDIAKKAGYSLGTISFVLNGKAAENRIPDETVQRILKTARELKYRPNISARRLRTSAKDRPLSIAVFWSTDFRAAMLPRFIRGLQDMQATIDKKIEILIHAYNPNKLLASSAFKMPFNFDAAIICNISQDEQHALETKLSLLPVVLYNRKSNVFCSVLANDSIIGSTAADVFISHGHKTAGIITAEAVFTGMDVRTNSFIQASSAAGMQVTSILNNENSMRGGYQTGQQLLQLDQMPDCIFCASDAMSAGLLRSFVKAGIKVPEDVEIISIGNSDSDIEENMIVALSVIHIPIEKMAQECLKLALGIIDQKTEAPFTQELPIHYIPRESCGPLK